MARKRFVMTMVTASLLSSSILTVGQAALELGGGKVEGIGGVAIGEYSVAYGQRGTVIGYHSQTRGEGNTLIGSWLYDSDESGQNISKGALLFGRSSRAVGSSRALLFGANHLVADSDDSFTIGSSGIVADSANALAVGASVKIHHSENGIALGYLARLTNAANSTVIGNTSEASSQHVIVLGNDSLVKEKAEHSVVIGNRSMAGAKRDYERIELAGIVKEGMERGQVADEILMHLGRANAYAWSTVIGDEAVSKGYINTVAGAGAIADGRQSVALGALSKTQGNLSVALGNLANTREDKSIAVGALATAEKADAVAIGVHAAAKVESGVALGADSKALVDKGVYGYDFRTGTAITEADILKGKSADAYRGQKSLLVQVEERERAQITKLNDLLRERESMAEGTSTAGISEDIRRARDELFSIRDRKARYESAANDFVNAWQATGAAVSVGNADTGLTRQITGVAAGFNDTDVVNVAQLKTAYEHVVNQLDGYSLKDGFGGLKLSDGKLILSVENKKGEKVEGIVRIPQNTYRLSKVKGKHGKPDRVILRDGESNSAGSVELPADTNTTYMLKSTANDDNTTTVTLTSNDDDEEATTFTVATKDTDTYTTGGRYDAATKKLTFTQNDAGKNYEVDLSGLAAGDTAADGTIGGDTDHKAVSGDTVKTYVDANKITVSGDEAKGITVTKDGNDYKVSLGDTLHAGAVTVGGAKGSAAVTGIANTTWDADNITSGRAATEDQLKAVDSKAKDAAEAAKAADAKADKATEAAKAADTKADKAAEAAKAADTKADKATAAAKVADAKADKSAEAAKAADTKAGQAAEDAKAADAKAGQATETAKAADTKAGQAVEAAKAADAKADKATEAAKAADAKAGQAAEAAKAADTKAQNALAEAAKHTTVVAGENISVTEKTGANGGKEYTVAVKAGTIDGDANTAFVTGDTVKQYVDANKTTVSGDAAKGITVTKDGNDYKVSLGDTLQAGAVTVGGAKGSEGVTGLANTTWDADNIASGRAATEDQLKTVDNKAKNAAAAAKAADTKADTATAAAKAADAKADKAAEAAKAADAKAGQAAEAAKAADAKADKAAEAAKAADTKADKATEAAKAADAKADKATEAAKAADTKAGQAAEAAKAADAKADKATEAAKAADVKADKAVADAKAADTKADKAAEAAKAADTKADTALAEAVKHTTVVAGSQITVTENTGANGGKAYTVAAQTGTIGGDKDANLVTGATVKAELDKLANGDARYLTAANVNAWQGKLGTGKVTADDKGLVTGDTVKKALGTLAQADAANLTPANVTSWQAKLGTGKISDNDKGLVTGDTVKQYVDANKTTVSGDEAKGITVTKSGSDYKVSLGDTLRAGAVTVGGAKGSEAVTGLANTTWNADKITSGRAATEDQLKAVDTEAKLAQQGVAANRDAISLLGHRLGDMDGQLSRVGAGAAALAALQPQDFDPDHKWDFSMGYGNYRSAHAMALGLYYRPNEYTLFTLGTALGGGENMINAGISLKIGRGEYTTTSKAVMAGEIRELKRQNAQMAQENESVKHELELLKAQVAALVAKK